MSNYPDVDQFVETFDDSYDTDPYPYEFEFLMQQEYDPLAEF